MKVAIASVLCAVSLLSVHGTEPLVAVHDSELTRALETMPAANTTPSGVGTTGNEWWPTQWHYFVMPESVEEALRSDGTAFRVVSDADISGGGLLDGNGAPRYPIVISLASEAVGEDEIARLTNYVAAGGTLMLGSSAFTRNTNGTTRGDFAFANELGMHTASGGLQNWTANQTFSKTTNHRLISHIPGEVLIWDTAISADEVAWGISPSYLFSQGHLIWRVQPSDATVIAQGDANPYVLVKPFGKGRFIYDASMQPLIGHGGNAPGMYAYGIFRNAIQWAFESLDLPIAKLSPWPYPYDAAFMIRHDLENLQDEITGIEASAQVEAQNGASGDYYFCTGTLRVEMTNSPAVVASLQRAVSNYNAMIGPHNGGLRNPNNPSLVLSDYDYWHWGADEALNVAATNLPGGYADGTAYALASVSNSLSDVDGWLGGLTNGLRGTAAPHFNATRDGTYAIEDQLGIKVTGDQKLSPFPSWVFSTQTADKRYSFITLPVSDWYVATSIAQSMDTGHSFGTLHDLVDYYYGLGALINLYSHTLSTGLGPSGSRTPDYLVYSLNTNLHPRVWSANASSIYGWWQQRSNAQVTAQYGTNGNASIMTLGITGASNPQSAVEVMVPRTTVSGLVVLTNGVATDASGYRINGQVIKVQVGTSVTNVQVSYVPDPNAVGDFYTVGAGTSLVVTASMGVLSNDVVGVGTNLTAVLVSGPSHGTLNLDSDGGFNYTPVTNYSGIDSFSYEANDGVTNSSPATVQLDVLPAGGLFFDDFTRLTDPAPLTPWVVGIGKWTNTGGVLQGASSGMGDYSDVYVAGNWTDYSVQGRVQLPHGAWAGGLEGRLNPLTGARYTLNVYPEGSGGDVNGLPTLKLLKFHGWRDLGPAAIVQVNLPPVGTNWHTLKLTFRGNRILAFFDGALMIDYTDTGFEGIPAYTSGGIGAHLFTYDFSYVATFDDIVVSTLPTAPLAVSDSYTVEEGRTLTVAASGVLANDLAGPGTNLIAVLMSGPTNGTLSLSANGGFSYTPTNNFVGADGFTYEVNDGVTNSDPAPVSITVTTNHPPVANDDSYGAVEDRLRTVSAPGVLGNDTDVDGDNLTAVLVIGPAHGTLNLNANGGFSYLPATNYVGPDSFIYEANDGLNNSGVATVNFTVSTNHPPVANTDNYGYNVNTVLAVGAPGVLGNDTDADGDPLTAVLVNGPAHGTLNLNANGGFTYTPATNFAGVDRFSYKANDGTADSGVATVTLTDPVAGSLFSDNFTRLTDPGPLSPWVVQAGTWTVTGGTLQGTNVAGTYGNVYLTNSWTNFTVEGRFQFSAGGYGGGLGGRLDPASGAHYAAWIYPIGHVLAGNNSDVINVIKFSDWNTASFLLPPGTITIPLVGTNWHTLKLAFLTNQISVYYDGNLMTTVADNTAPYLSGGISADMFTDTTPYTLSVDDVLVDPLVTDDRYNVVQNTTLTVGDTGVLGNDTGVFGTNLTATVVSGPGHGTLTLSTNGGFTYTPSTNFAGTDSFTYEASDGTTNLGPATATITVIPVLTVTADNQSRNYGGSNPTLTGTLAGVQNGDNITASYTTTADAASPVGTYAIVPGLNDPDGKLVNYVVITNNGTLTVNPVPLTVTADDKNRAYGVANPALTASYNGFVNEEGPSVLTTPVNLGTVADDSSGVGAYPITASGAVAANYVISYVAGTLTVNPAVLTISSGISANNKIYDGNTTGTISSNNVVLTGVVGGDTVNLVTNGYTATFAGAGVGNWIGVTVSGLTLGGAGAGNYTLSQPGGLTANITSKGVTIASGINADNKVYDGTTAATISSNTVVLTGVVGGDAVTLVTNGYTATFASAGVGNGIGMTVGGLTLGGASAGNYTLSQPGRLTANITSKGVTIASGISADNKVYDGNTTATISSNTVVLTGVVGGDVVELVTNGYTATFASAGVGDGIAVTMSGLTLGGDNAANYALNQPALNAIITSRGVVISSGISVDAKLYDGNTTAMISSNNVVLAGVVGGDVVELVTNGYSATFASADVGNGIGVTVSGLTLGGASAGNYSLSQPTGLAADIVAAGPPVITLQPRSQTVSMGSNVTLFVVAIGAPAHACQWFFNSLSIPEAVDVSLTITNFLAVNEGSYHVVLTNDLGSAASDNAELYLDSPLRFVTFSVNTSFWFRTRLVGPAGGNFVIQGSTNMPDWTVLVTNQAPNGIFDFTDTNRFPITNRFGVRSYRFYRGSLAP